MGLPTPKGAVFRLETDHGLTHDYSAGFQTQTLSGSMGASFFTASATVATAAARQGQNIAVTAGNHIYNITSVDVDGVTINVTPPLTQAYSGSGFKPDIAGLINGSSGFGESAAQVTDANKPCYLHAYQNGLDVIEFTGAAKALEIANYDALDGIFANGGTIAVELAVIDDGGSNAGRIFTKKNGAGTEIWNLITTNAGGGFCKLLFNYVTTGTTGSFATTEFVIALGAPKIIELTYNASTPTVPPVINIIGKTVLITTTSVPTGTALSDAGGSLIIGNSASGARGFNGRIMAAYAWKRDLGNYERKVFRDYLSTKWDMDLYFDPAGMTLYYLGRPYQYAEPDDPVGKPLVIFYPGGGGTGQELAQALMTTADLGQEVIRVFITGTDDQFGSPTLNSGGPQTFNKAPDVEYFYSFINYLIAQGKVDPTRIYEWGHSNGAMFAYRFAIEHPELIARVFSVAGNVMVDNPNTYTGRIKHFHGAADPNVPITGGEGINGIIYPVPQTAVQGFTHANSGAGVTAGSTLDKDFVVLPSPAAHTLTSINIALGLSPYNTTLLAQSVAFILG